TGIFQFFPTIADAIKDLDDKLARELRDVGPAIVFDDHPKPAPASTPPPATRPPGRPSQKTSASLKAQKASSPGLKSQKSSGTLKSKKGSRSSETSRRFREAQRAASQPQTESGIIRFIRELLGLQPVGSSNGSSSKRRRR